MVIVKVTPEEAASGAQQITTNHEQMENGEFRFRLQCKKDNTAYIRTVSQVATSHPPPQQQWQNSHFHKGVKETFIVQSGWMALADLPVSNSSSNSSSKASNQNNVPDISRRFADAAPESALRVRVFREGDIVTTEPWVVHNCYMPANAIVHTVKHGHSDVNPDWFAAPELDALTKGMSEERIFQLAREYDARRATEDTARANSVYATYGVALLSFVAFSALLLVKARQ